MKKLNKTSTTAETTAAPVRAKKAPAETKHPISKFTTAAFYKKLIASVNTDILSKLAEHMIAYPNTFYSDHSKANSIASLLEQFIWKDTPEGKMYWLRFQMKYRSGDLSSLNKIEFASATAEPKKDVFNVSNSEMNSIEISVPGYVLDTENSTLGKIVLKAVTTAVEEPKKPALPKTWNELERISGYYVTASSSIQDVFEENCISYTDRNIFATRKQAEASIALAQLSQLREVYRQGWVPNWNDQMTEKYCILCEREDLEKAIYRTTRAFLSFQSREIRDQFLENFRDLIQQAKPLMS